MPWWASVWMPPWPACSACHARAVRSWRGDGYVLINGVTAGKSDRLGAFDIIEVTIPEPESKPTPVTDMGILYDDEDIVVVDKPVGVAAHTGPGWEGPTVLGNLEAAGYRITSYGPPERQGIVHRLDVGTSGAMMVAKSELAYTVMKRAFKERTIEKVYHAVVAGHLDPASGTIDAPIGRHPSREWRMAVMTAASELSPTTTPWNSWRGPNSRRYTWRRDVPTRSACIWPP